MGGVSRLSINRDTNATEIITASKNQWQSKSVTWEMYYVCVLCLYAMVEFSLKWIKNRAKVGCVHEFDEQWF